MDLWFIFLFIGTCSALLVKEHWRYVSANGMELRRGIFGVHIQKNTLWTIAPMAVTPEPDRTIDLSSLNIQELRNNVFDYLANVTILDLSNNEIENIPPLIFVKLKTLQTLSLANNKLRIFDRCFIGLRNLRSLNLSNNLIVSLTSGDLLGLPTAVNLTMTGNPLKKFAINFENQSLPYYVPSESDRNPWTGPPNSDLGPVVKMQMNLLNVPSDNVYMQAWRSYNLRRFHMELCKTEYGIVESFELAEQGELKHCQVIRPQKNLLILKLDNLEIRQFQSNWYRISNDFFETINLSSNRIINMNRTFLNNLPRSIIFVRLENNKIQRIQRNSIRNEFLQKLSFSYNEIEMIDDGAFEGTKLVSILLDHNDLKDNLNFTKTLPKSIQELILSWNGISKVPEDFLLNLTNLKYVKLGHNKIAHLPVKTFKGLKELRIIDLTYNSLESIEPGIFEDQENLSLLVLSYNNIKEIAPGTFNGLKKIHSILLTDNDITRITKNSFSGLRHLILHTITLSKNSINTIEEGSFSYMTIHNLYLNSNNISERSVAKGAFELCTLYELIYYSNPIKSINSDLFRGLLLYMENRFAL